MIKTFTGRPIRIHENRMDVLVYGNGIVTINRIHNITLLDHLKIMMEPGGKEVHNVMTYQQWTQQQDELHNQKLREPSAPADTEIINDDVEPYVKTAPTDFDNEDEQETPSGWDDPEEQWVLVCSRPVV